MAKGSRERDDDAYLKALQNVQIFQLVFFSNIPCLFYGQPRPGLAWAALIKYVMQFKLFSRLKELQFRLIPVLAQIAFETKTMGKFFATTAIM